MSISIAEFVQRWKLYEQSEISGYQAHFLNLCELLGQPQPAEADAIGERYAFQKYVGKVSGGKGFAHIAPAIFGTLFERSSTATAARLSAHTTRAKRTSLS